jgi:hypothetical protein
MTGSSVTAPLDAVVQVASAEVSVDAAAPASAAPVTPPGPRAPGIYPVLVVHRLDHAPHAYILACAQIVNDKPTTLLGPAACAKVIGAPAVELVSDNGTRTPVTLGKPGKGVPCPGDGPDQPWLAIDGLPAKRAQLFVLPVGMNLEDRPVSAATLATLQQTHVSPPRRGGGTNAREPVSVLAQLDLDGDGVFEIITDHLGSVRLFRSSGQMIGEVGCQFI